MWAAWEDAGPAAVARVPPHKCAAKLLLRNHACLLEAVPLVRSVRIVNHLLCHLLLCPQIFNLEAKAKLKSVQFGQQVVFWKWISATKLGLVTASAVYHWDMQVRFACW